MADTSKDELVLGGGINRITTTSRRKKQVVFNQSDTGFESGFAD